jgi:glycosyltransferase involved in cell wall biosynthesis
MKHTVAIPSYRRPTHLRRALEALMVQERMAEEVIVVARKDDWETQRIAHELQDELCLTLQLVDGPGVITPMNRALDTATGDIISFIDDDAVPHRDWARRIIHVFETEPDLAGLGGRDHIFINGEWLEGTSKVVGIVHWYGRVEGNHHRGVGPRRNVDVLKGVNMSLRMSALGNCRIDTRLRGSGAQWHWELKFCLDLRAQGKHLAYDPAIIVDHYPAPRFDADQRSAFDPSAYENQVYNMTLSLLEHLNPLGRMLLMLYALSVGMKNHYCGALKTLLYWPRLRHVAWIKGMASARGVYAAWKDYKPGHNAQEHDTRMRSSFRCE